MAALTKASTVEKLRHAAAFAVAGFSAFAVDAIILGILVHWGANPYLARLVAVGCAMVVGWLVNRTWTFRAPGPPRLREFLRYATVAGFSVTVNYAIYVLVLMTWASATPFRSLVIATALTTAISYFGYRFFAFGGVTPDGSAPPAASGNARRETE